MIQRKQTLYLLLSGILMAILPFVTSYAITTQDHYLNFNTFGLYQIGGAGVEGDLLIRPTWGLAVLNVIIVLLSIISIFLYKRRVLQMRVTVYNLLLKIGLLILGGMYIYKFGELYPDALKGVRAWVALPFISIILDYLAHRAIAVDERLVQYLKSGRLR